MPLTRQAFPVTHCVENPTPYIAFLALTASTVTLSCDFSGFASMNRSPVQAEGGHTLGSRRGGERLDFYLQSHFTVTVSPGGRSSF